MLKVNDFALEVDAFKVGRLNFQLTDGKSLVVMGPSGSGKSVLLEALAGQRNFSGSCDGPHGVLVRHQPLLFPHLSVAQNIGYPLRSQGEPRGKESQEVQHWSQFFRIADLLTRSPASLSIGQARRVALARALAAQPQLLLLDEAFAGLESSLRFELIGELLGAQASTGMMMILATHSQEAARLFGGEIALLNQGGFVGMGQLDELLSAPGNYAATQSLGLGNVVSISELPDDYVQAQAFSSVTHVYFPELTVVAQPSSECPEVFRVGDAERRKDGHELPPTIVTLEDGETFLRVRGESRPWEPSKPWGLEIRKAQSIPIFSD
ncbi:MAG: ATP-binding cassette domain-containing protein [Polyangiaceae bacterium]|nr:ATP-binding cassette domain-containing protein [Polyangiaceae bacterium]